MAPKNHNHYNTNDYAGDEAADTRRVMNHMPDEDRSTTQEIQQSINTSQAAELTDGVRMGDDRAIGDTPSWESFKSQELYNFATKKNSPTTADDLGRAFNDGGNNLAQAANALFDAVSRLDGAWSGVAADSAKNALKPLAQAAGTAGQTAQLMGVRMSEQSVAATEVRKLPPAEEYDSQQSLNAMLAGGPVAMQQDLKAQKDAADAVKREQVSYLNTYTQSMTAVDAQTPSFVPPQETISGRSSDSTSISSTRIFTPTTNTPTTRTNTTTTTTNNHNVNDPTNTTGKPPTVNTQIGQNSHIPTGTGTTTTTSGFTPPSTTSGPNTFGPSGGAGPTTGGGQGQGFGGGFGPGFGPGGAGAGSGAGAGAGANSGSNGPRGMAPGEVAPSRTAAGTGRGGQGMGGGGRGKGEGEEDKEHERPSYLVEGDPESTFGNDQLTAPPVIGGDD